MLVMLLPSTCALITRSFVPSAFAAASASDGVDAAEPRGIAIPAALSKSYCNYVGML